MKSKVFFKHLALAILFYALFIFSGSFLLSLYTKHGDSISVPDLKNKSVADAVKTLNALNLVYKISDSVYAEKTKDNLVMDQSPKPNSKVKEMRTIYLTVSTTNPGKIKMPSLIDASLRQAQMVLESYGLKQGSIVYKHDIAKNAVLDQLLGGKSIKAGTTLTKGSRIDLVVGDGLGEGIETVPDLRGLTLSEAKLQLDASGLNLGAVVTDNTFEGDTLKGFIYNQIPAANDATKNKIQVGESVDVFITNDVTKIPPELLDQKISNELNEPPK